jgi:hypothetical protein
METNIFFFEIWRRSRRNRGVRIMKNKWDNLEGEYYFVRLGLMDRWIY